MTRVHVERVELRVSDVEQSARFYERLTGMAVRSLDLDSAALGAPDGGPDLLRLRRAARPGRAPRQAAGLFHTAFLYAGRARLAATLNRIVRDGIPLTGASDHGVSEALYLDDPDGIGIELYRDRPRSEWPPPAPGERIGMYTIALDVDDLRAAADGGDEAERAHGLTVGHAHLKVADVEAATRFWTEEVGMEVMVALWPQAVFLADGGYHHHIGANSWMSAGQPLEPRDGPGLDALVIGGADREAARQTPDGVTVRLGLATL